MKIFRFFYHSLIFHCIVFVWIDRHYLNSFVFKSNRLAWFSFWCTKKKISNFCSWIFSKGNINAHSTIDWHSTKETNERRRKKNDAQENYGNRLYIEFEGEAEYNNKWEECFFSFFFTLWILFINIDRTGTKSLICIYICLWYNNVAHHIFGWMHSAGSRAHMEIIIHIRPE